MTLEQLNAKVRDWDLQHTGSAQAKSKYGIMLDHLYYHASREWRVYLPAEHPDYNNNYMERLSAWIGNAQTENDQKLLLEYATYISFISHDDFAALYRTAMDREVYRWIAEQVGAKFDTGGGRQFNSIIRNEIQLHTLFCPITDSLDINEFYKVNHLAGMGHRPAISTLEMLAQKAAAPTTDIAVRLRNYIDNPSLDPIRPRAPIKRLVLLEDIVGSGSQCRDAIRWAVTSLRLPTLFIPLVLCPNGASLLETESRNSGGLLSVRPVILLTKGDLLGPERGGAAGWSISSSMEAFAATVAPVASAGMDTFGYRDTGCSLATFANTPDNSLPLVHNKPRSGRWLPLFPRVFRD